jgi:putative methionine-R-sulfoxide reductase with GAF domain
MTPVHEELLQEFRNSAKSAATAESLMDHMAQRLHEKMTRYNWVGFYLVDPADPGILVVGPFVGSFTPNARIPLDTGLCGAAATTGKTVVVQDVTKDPRYLAGSSMVNSEVVVPIFVKGKLAGDSMSRATLPIPSIRRNRNLSKRVRPSSENIWRRDSPAEGWAYNLSYSRP